MAALSQAYRSDLQEAEQERLEPKERILETEEKGKGWVWAKRGGKGKHEEWHWFTDSLPVSGLDGAGSGAWLCPAQQKQDWLPRHLGWGRGGSAARTGPKEVSALRLMQFHGLGLEREGSPCQLRRFSAGPHYGKGPEPGGK